MYTGKKRLRERERERLKMKQGPRERVREGKEKTFLLGVVLLKLIFNKIIQTYIISC